MEQIRNRKQRDEKDKRKGKQIQAIESYEEQVTDRNHWKQETDTEKK